MCKYFEIKYMQIYFAHLLITLNVPLRTGKCTPGVHVPWETPALGCSLQIFGATLL